MVVCTPTKKARIYTLSKHGYHPSEIAEEIGVSQRTVERHRNRLLSSPNPDFYEVKPGRGRPRKLTERDLRRARMWLKLGRALDGADVHRQLFADRGIGRSTVQRALASVKLNGRVRRKKPFLNSKHIRARKAWSKTTRHWSAKMWQLIAFTDESRFELFKSGGSRYCRRGPNEEFQLRNLKPVVKHGGGGVTVWGMITSRGVGRLHRVEGNMDAKQYCSILQESLLGSLQDVRLSSKTIIFQQDNDPKHTSKLATAWLKNHNFHVLPWPPNSPDMSIIEPLWDILDKRIRRRKRLPTNEEELWKALQEEWYSIDRQTIQSLYSSMPRRVQALSAAKGHHTKY
jgi:transposase